MYAVEITDTRSGETRSYRVEDHEWDSAARHLWSEGNYACDCNRHLFFLRAGGDPEPEEGDDVPCGDDLYTVTRNGLPPGESP